jgi:hypothetical protein
VKTRGNQFADWQEPDLFTTEIRAAFRSLREGGVMSTTGDTATEMRSFQIEIPQEQIDDLRRRIAATRWPTKELVEDRSQGVQLATLRELRPLLDDRIRLAHVRGTTERTAAVHNRDRRGGNPLHPLQVPT